MVGGAGGGWLGEEEGRGGWERGVLIQWNGGMEWNKCYSNILQLTGWHQCQPATYRYVIEIIKECGSVTSSWEYST